MNPVRIGKHVIGPGEATFVIAEIGVNHDGSLEKAIELVQAAADCGADAVKLQIFHAATLMHASSVLAGYQKENCREKDPAEMLRRYELSGPAIQQITEAIAARGMMSLATPFSLPDVEVVRTMRFPAIKIASPDLVNYPLLRSAASLGRPLLISTGAATLDEMETTVQWLRQWGAGFAFLHCVSSYPTPLDQANLCWIGEIANRFDVIAGFSDHTMEVNTGALAVAAGAMIVEKHLTYDRGASGPDHAASADPRQFSQYLRLIRQAELLRGRPGKHVLDVERDVRQVSRQSLVAGRNLLPGEVIQERDLIVQRPGTGIPAGQILTVAGRKVRRPIEAGAMLMWDMFE